MEGFALVPSSIRVKLDFEIPRDMSRFRGMQPSLKVADAPAKWPTPASLLGVADGSSQVQSWTWLRDSLRGFFRAGLPTTPRCSSVLSDKTRSSTASYLHLGPGSMDFCSWSKPDWASDLMPFIGAVTQLVGQSLQEANNMLLKAWV